MKKRLRIYEIKNEYIKYLSNYQEHLFLHTNEKGKRKYIGIVFQINGINFFAPLSSYKTKHVKMRESVDFIKIKDYAVINLNNMIPIPQSQIVEIDINKEKYDIFEYKFLTNLYLKDIIVGYFIKNNKWTPKDKNLFKCLKNENLELYKLCKKVIKSYEYEDLECVYKYIFSK